MQLGLSSAGVAKDSQMAPQPEHYSIANLDSNLYCRCQSPYRMFEYVSYI